MKKYLVLEILKCPGGTYRTKVFDEFNDSEEATSFTLFCNEHSSNLVFYKTISITFPKF